MMMSISISTVSEKRKYCVCSIASNIQYFNNLQLKINIKFTLFVKVITAHLFKEQIIALIGETMLP